MRTQYFDSADLDKIAMNADRDALRYRCILARLRSCAGQDGGEVAAYLALCESLEALANAASAVKDAINSDNL